VAFAPERSASIHAGGCESLSERRCRRSWDMRPRTSRCPPDVRSSRTRQSGRRNGDIVRCP